MSVNKFLGGKLELIAGSTPAVGGAGSIVRVQLSSNKGNPINNVEIILNIKGTDYKSTTDNSGLAILSGVQDVGTATISTGLEAYPSRSLKIDCFSAYDVMMMDSDPYEDWMVSAGLSTSSYASLDELLEDEKAVRTLMTKKESVDILANFITGDDLATIINHRYAAKWINYREYAYSTLSENEIIKELMDESGMYGMYITAESKSRPLVPVLTSNTGSDGGVASSNGVLTSGSEYKAFDGDASTSCVITSNKYIQYKFTNIVKISTVEITTSLPSGYTRTGTFKYSMDGSNWTDIETIILSDTKPTIVVSDLDIIAQYLRYESVSHVGGVGNTEIFNFQIYGYQLEGLVPTLTSNNGSDGGEAFGDGTNQWYVFSGTGNNQWNTSSNGNQSVGYRFAKPKIVNAVSIDEFVDKTYHSAKDFIVQASNNGSDWFDIYSDTLPNKTTRSVSTFSFSNSNSYYYWRLLVLNTYNGNVSAYSLQFYGKPTFWQPKGLVPVMTSNTAPYGTASASSNQTNYEAYKAFNEISNTDGWASSGASNQWICYKFVNPTKVTRFNMVVHGDHAGLRLKNYKIEASNDNTTWVNLYSGITDNANEWSNITVSFDNDNYYMYYRLYAIDVHGHTGTPEIYIRSLQFYGRQLEALIPPMTSNTAPIGEASATTGYTGEPYLAFDNNDTTSYVSASNQTSSHLTYKFANYVNVRKILYSYTNSSSYVIDIAYSDDGIVWETVLSSNIPVSTSLKTFVYDVNENDYHLYWRINFRNGTGMKFGAYTLQFYGTPDYESRTYIYDHGVEVMEVTSEGYRQTNITINPITKEHDSIKFRCEGTQNSAVMGGTNSKIDFTNYKILCLRYKINLAFNNSGLYVVSDKLYDNNNNTAASTQLKGNVNGIYTACLDVNNINNNYYIFARAFWTSETVANKAQDFDVIEWWLE